MEQQYPEVSAELISRLEEQFPLRNPSLNMSLDEIRYKSGQRSVVEFLKAQHNYQTTPQKD